MEYAIIRMNEVFPSDNDVAKWVVGLAVIHNDFLFLKKKLFKSSDVLSDLISEAPSILKILTLLQITIVVVQSLSHVQFFATLWTTAYQASQSFTISWSLL